MHTKPAPLSWPLGLILAGLAVYVGGMLLPAFGAAGYPAGFRISLITLSLSALSVLFWLASRRVGYEVGYRRAFRIISVGFGLSAVTQGALLLPLPSTFPIRGTSLHILGYLLCAWGVHKMPKRAIARTDFSIIVTDFAAAVIAMAVVLLVLLRDGTPSPSLAPNFLQLMVVQLLSMLLALGIANTLALRGLPVPDRRTVQWCAIGLVLLVASSFAALMFAAQLWPDRRLVDALYGSFLAVELLAAWSVWCAPITPVESHEVPALRTFVRLGPMPITLLVGSVAVAVSCFAAGQDRSALIATVGVFVSCVPIIARLQLSNALRQAAGDAQIAEREARLDAMMRLAGGFAHELNNALTTIMNAADLARTAPDAETRERDLEEIRLAAARAAALARQTLVASGRSMPSRSPTPLTEIVERAIIEAQDDLGSRWRIRTDIADPSIVALTDAEQCAGLVRLMVRIIRGAQPEGGELVIRIESHDFRERKETAGARVSAGTHAGISVLDQAGLAADAALPDASILFDRDIAGEPTLAFDLTIARGLALSLDAGLELCAKRGLGARATMLLRVS